MKKAAAVFACLLVISCGGDKKSGINVKPLENAFTLELKFGDKNLPNEYLLANPGNLVVANNGDIIVTDESRLKVFDASGKPKQIIRRPGPGPGEFGDALTINFYYSEDGYISVSDPDKASFHFFSPEYKFIEQINTNLNPMNSQLLRFLQCDRIGYEIYLFKDNSMLFSIRGIVYRNASRRPSSIGNIDKTIDAVVLKQNNDWKLVYKFEQIINSDHLYIPSPEFGTLVNTFLPGLKVAYSDPIVHRKEVKGKWYYTIVVQNIITGEKREMQQEYSPVPIREETIELTKKRHPEIAKVMEKLKYYAPLLLLTSDGDYIFAYMNNGDSPILIGDRKGYLVDIFRASNGEYVSSVHIPFVIRIFKDGYGYRINKSQNEFPVIEKYRINPAVYGK